VTTEMIERPTASGVTFYRPADVAKQLRCSEWWIKEQARRGRIPFSWIGGSYLFTPEHIAEIVILFERRPTDPPVTGSRPTTATRPHSKKPRQPQNRLTARTPRRARARQVQQQTDAA